MNTIAEMITCRIAATEEIISLRAAELRKGKPGESARFPEDELKTTIHYGAFLHGRPASCLTLIRNPESAVPTWQLRGMATDSRLQRQNLGSTLWSYVESDLRSRHPVFRIWCNARVNAVPFYTKLGFTVISGSFHIPSIGLHYKMEKTFL